VSKGKSGGGSRVWALLYGAHFRLPNP
jgi:hypothetical protein